MHFKSHHTFMIKFSALKFWYTKEWEEFLKDFRRFLERMKSLFSVYPSYFSNSFILFIFYKLFIIIVILVRYLLLLLLIYFTFKRMEMRMKKWNHCNKDLNQIKISFFLEVPLFSFFNFGDLIFWANCMTNSKYGKFLF